MDLHHRGPVGRQVYSLFRSLLWQRFITPFRRSIAADLRVSSAYGHTEALGILLRVGYLRRED